MKTRLLATSLLALSGAVALGGCVYRERVVQPAVVQPAASPATTVVVAAPNDRVVTYPEGRYELRGDGTTSSPYYWVWIPTGYTPTHNPPQPPARPQTQ